MPNGNINSDALDSLFDPKGNVVLEQFEDSAYGTTAVLLRPESAAYRAQTGLGDPYVVAYGYDKETGEWSHGYYTSNLSYAVDRANPEILEEATIKWQREDFEAALEEKGLEPSKAVEAVRGVTNPVAAVAHDVVGRGLPDAPTDPIR